MTMDRILPVGGLAQMAGTDTSTAGWLGMNTFMGAQISVSIHATKMVENWQVKKRSKRLLKKLTKLRGPQFTREPCATRTPFGWIVHPEVMDQMRKHHSASEGEA